MLRKVAFVLAFLFLLAEGSFSAPEDLDPTFGTNGLVFYGNPNLPEEIFGVAIQADGKIVVAGYVLHLAKDVLLLRYNSDGTLDNTFGINGVVSYDGGWHEEAYGVAIQPNGKIVVVGYTYSTIPNGGTDVLILRFNSDGALDDTFGAGGVGSYDINPDEINNGDFGYSLAIQPDGKIVVAGSSSSQTQGNALLVLRCNSDGTLDDTFGENGVVLYNSGQTNGQDIAYSVAIQSDGNIVVTGSSTASPLNQPYVIVLRVTTDGELDNTFGTGGVLKYRYNGNYSEGRGIVVQPDGKIAVAGGSWDDDFRTSVFVLRLNADGTLDDTFGINGAASFSASYGFAIALQPNGKIVVAGSWGLVLRFKSQGQLDTATAYWGGGGTHFYAIALQEDKKIVVAGSNDLHDQTSDLDTLCVRFIGGDPPDLPTPISPSGTFTATTPTYIWSAVPTATGYFLWVDDSTGTIIQQSYTASEADCASGTGTCSVTPAIALALGSGQWKIQASNAEGSSPWSNTMSFTVGPSVTLQSPSDAAAFDSSFLIAKYQPSFTWTPHGTYTTYTILFSTSPEDFTSKGVVVAKAKIKSSETSYTPAAGPWKKIMVSSYNQGNIRDIYWMVIGTTEDKTGIESEVRSFRIETPQLVTIISPEDEAILSVPPTFEFTSHGNTKFKLEFSSQSEFDDSKKMKAFSITTKDPNLDQVVLRTLTSGQWNAVKKLVGSATGYFRIRAWDIIKRETVSLVRSFSIQ